MNRLVWTTGVAGVAAALIAAGSVLDWIALDSPGVTFADGQLDGSATGIETGFYGRAGLILATTLVLSALLSVMEPLRKLSTRVVLLGGLAALGLAIFVFMSLESRFVDYAVTKGVSTELQPAKLRSLLRALFEEGSISVRPAIGLILLAVGGGTALIAGIVGLARSRPIRPDRRGAGGEAIPSPPPQTAGDRFGF